LAEKDRRADEGSEVGVKMMVNEKNEGVEEEKYRVLCIVTYFLHYGACGSRRHYCCGGGKPENDG